MLGGSFGVALLRNSMGAALTMTVFLLLDRPRFALRRTALYYVLYGCFAAAVFSVWYILDRDSYISLSGVASIPATGIFCTLLSGDRLYLSLYKLSLGFYLLALTVFCGIDGARVWFGSSLYADIMIRILCCAVILSVIAGKIRNSFLAGVDFLADEMDLFSIVTLFVSIMIAGLVIFLPADRTFSMVNIARIAVLFVMAGLIQYMMFRMYLHQGREHRYQVEKELLEMNKLLLNRQLELMHESEEEMIRIRHDIRHHCIMIEEYIRNGDSERLLDYVRQYGADVEKKKRERVCANETINSILTAYARYARDENIRVSMNVKTDERLAVRDIDLVAVLANLVENAIHGCLSSRKPAPEINISIIQKGNKIAISCRNTCMQNIAFHKGLPRSSKGGGVGVTSIAKVASCYHGETDFSMEEGMFVARIVLGMPAEA